jgi:hypothetical protein
MLPHLWNWFLGLWLFLVLVLRYASILDVIPLDFGVVASGSCRRTRSLRRLTGCRDSYASGLAAALILDVTGFSGSLAALRC